MALTVSVRRASPLALAIIEAEGVPLDRIVRWLRPTAKAARRWKLPPHLFRYACAGLVQLHGADGPSSLEDALFRSRYDVEG